MPDIVKSFLPTSDFGKFMFGGSLEPERGGGHLGNFRFSFEAQNRNNSCCLSDLLKIPPHREHFFVCVIVHTGFVL